MSSTSPALQGKKTNDTLPLNQEFFRPLGMEHFYDSFALESQISVRREAMRLFGLREDELMPDLHITRDGVLRIRLGAHQEHQVNHVARATDRTKVSAAVIQLASHEEDTAPQQDMSEGDASDSDGSESASDSEQNDPPSSLVADAEQYELMQRAYAAVGEDFTGKDDLFGAQYSKLLKLEMVPERWPLARLSFSLQTCVDLRAVLTHETKKLYNDSTVHLLCSNTGYSRFTRNYCTHRPATMLPGNVKENDLAVAWHGLQRMPNHPNSGGRRFLARVSVTGLDTCQADTLQVWFPAHWAPVVLQHLQKKQDK